MIPIHQLLLVHAGKLLAGEATEHREADLRRGVSALYYAMFHLLTYDTVNLHVRDSGITTAEDRRVATRGFKHASVFDIATSLCGNSQMKDSVKAIYPNRLCVPSEIRQFCRTISKLYTARLASDYEPIGCIIESIAMECLFETQVAVEVWRDVKQARPDDVRVFTELIYQHMLRGQRGAPSERSAFFVY